MPATVQIQPLVQTSPKRTVQQNAHRRNYFLPNEIEKMCQETRITRPGRNKLLRVRDELVIRLAYSHGLRVIEQQRLLWEDILLDQRKIHVVRVKGSISCDHPIYDSEIKLLKKWQRIQGIAQHVFTHLDGTPMSKRSLQAQVTAVARLAGIPLKAHHHMLRHGCGFRLVNDGTDIRVIQQYLGHKNIQHTVRYTFLTDKAFTRFRF